MAQRGIREYEGKKILFDGLAKSIPYFKGKSEKLALVRPDTDPKQLVKDHPWLLKEKLVAKPDQLFGKRGKHGLLCLNADWKTAWKWISDRMNKTVTVGKTTGELKDFDTVVFDPPRQGAEAQAHELAKSAVPVIAAVSCDAATFARDARILVEGGYRMTAATPIDQFRYSPHVEIAARFEK